MDRCRWGVLLAILGVAGCRGFLPPPPGPVEAVGEDDVVVGLGNIEKKRTIEVRGTFDDGRFIAKRIKIEDPDDEVELKGLVTAAIRDGSGAVGGVAFHLDESSRLEDTDGADIPASRFEPGAWAKAECIQRGGRLFLRKITLREREADEREQLQGRVESVDFGRGRLEIGGIPVTFDDGVAVVWDAEGPAPERQDASAGSDRGLRRVRVIDDDNWRPESGLGIGDWLAITGEIQTESEYRNNHNLRDNRDRDRLIHDLSAKLEFTFTPTRRLFAFASVAFDYEIVHFDEGADVEGGDDFNLEEGFILLEDIPIPGISLQIGRQDFDHGREWVMDDQIDGARMWVNLDQAVAEISISRILFDSDPEEDGITNYLAGLHAEPFEDTNVFAYYMHRREGTLVDLSRNHIGVSLEGEVGAFHWWLDLGHSFGQEGGRRVSGYGVDAAAMWVFEDVPLEPSIYAGIAWGSGDDGDSSGTDRAFRQTGIQDNTDKFNGVASFRYLGEMVRPELSNLIVLTAGFGFRLGENTSLDFVWHHYRQDVAAPFLRDTRLRLDPTGESRDIGNAYEVIIGIEDFRPVEMELVLAWFEPGAAFGRDADAAMYVTFQIEWNF